MADLIDREKLISTLRQSHSYHAETSRDFSLLCRDIRLVKEQPSVDAVEVVRCEKCKHAVWDEETKLWKCVESAEYDEELGGYFGFCEYHYGDFFCSYGKRKDGDD